MKARKPKNWAAIVAIACALAGTGCASVEPRAGHDGEYGNIKRGGSNLDRRQAHKGVDWKGHHRQAIIAPADGVVYAVYTPRYSWIVKGKWATKTGGPVLQLAHEMPDGRRFYTKYAHCDEIFVSEDQEGKRGQQIAAMGNKGCSRECDTHLHFEIHVGQMGEHRNPLDYISGCYNQEGEQPTDGARPFTYPLHC